MTLMGAAIVLMSSAMTLTSSWSLVSAHAKPAATKTECIAACPNQLAACNQQCSEFGTSERECERDVLRLCRRSGVSACFTAQDVLPCGYSGPFPPFPDGVCAGTCPPGMRCSTLRFGRGGLSCFCRPVAEWRISCGTGFPLSPVCDGECPDGFQCVRQSVNTAELSSECVCVPSAFVDVTNPSAP